MSALSRASVLLLAVVLTAAASTVSPIGTRRTSRDAAVRELSALLEPGERVEAQAFASQRRASDVWRLSHGVVAATDRRVVYVAAPPFPLLRPRDDGPRELYLEEWSYASAFVLVWESDVTGGRVLALRAPARQALLRVESGDVPRAEQVLAAAAAARRAATDEMARLDGTSRLPAPMPTRYVVHVVRRGESLSLLARTYNTSVNVLRQLNGLVDDRVQVGQRLRVPERVDDSDPFDTLPPDSTTDMP